MRPIVYRPEVLKEDLRDLPRNIRTRIVRAIESRLGTEPERYGSRLRRSLVGLWKLRVRDYRVVYDFEGETVRIWMIAHRSRVYDEVARRRSGP
jgi:mRNA-degrading endonuclease RelE of RelBE toxin-antitoxin system